MKPTVRGTMLSLTILLTASAPARAGEPPQAVKDIASLVGHWKGTGVLTMGADKANLQITWSCQPASGGWGVSCLARFTGMPGGGVYLENDLFGFEPGTQKYHWFSVTNQGETHDHVSDGPKGDVAEFVHTGVQDGKPLQETVRMTFTDDCRKLDVRVETTLAGQVVGVLEAHVHK